MFHRHLQFWTKCLCRRIPKITSPNQCQSRTSGADKTFGRTKSVPLQAQLMTKVNLEQQIKDKPVYIPKTKHVVTQRERSILERIVEAEATDKDEKSKILVANVILNRVRSKEFPNSIEAVVFQRAYGKVQFSPTADGRYESVHITKSTKRSVKKALEDGIDYSEGALYFVEKTMANPKNVSWFDEALTRLFTYQGHSFYK